MISATNSHYHSPEAITALHDDSRPESHSEQHIVRPTSSNYSVSIDPTPLPSRRGSVRNRDVDGAWTRLRLGSEYDGDRTFVPSEANLQLGKGKGGAM